MATSEDTSVERGGVADWMRLLRLPNLFTVPGDVIAGFVLAGGGLSGSGAGRLAVLAAASVCLYSAGLILNDVFDVRRDRRERPDRPLASGRISLGAAVAVAVLLDVMALGLAWTVGARSLAAAGVIAALVLIYNGAARRVAAAGFGVMGLCRGANLLLGASISDSIIPIVLVAAAAETAYVVALTAAAADETEGAPKGALRWASPAVLAAGLVAVMSMVAVPVAGGVAALVALAAVGLVAVAMKADLAPEKAPPLIGRLVRALIPVQAAFVLMGGSARIVTWSLAAGLYMLWPIAGVASRSFRGS